MSAVIPVVISLALTIVVVIWMLRAFSKKIENNVLTKIEDSFSRASMQALSNNTDQFLKLAGERLSKETDANVHELTSKKELIDNSLQQMKSEMERVKDLISSFEKDRNEKFGAITKGLSYHSAQTEKLQELTGKLNLILSDSRQRGLWGQRIADDILRLVGMEEGINYVQQKTMDGSSRRPDFTFLLPNGKKINMDVKFPLDNFKHYLEETVDAVRQNYKNQFIRDARQMVKQVITREYINPDANTLDYVIIFIPLEQAYAFIMENDATFIDDALKSKVIVCSPWTIYALLAVVRQSIDNFNLEKSANKILELMSIFYKQWGAFISSMDRIGKKIEELQNEYNSLLTTRRNQLEKPLHQIEQLSKLNEQADDNGPSPVGVQRNNGRTSGGNSINGI